MPEIPLEMILKATGGRLSGGPAPEVMRGVSTDTRGLAAGALFVALRGEQFDGHDFLADAFRRGAAAALVSREVAAPGPLVMVEDTLAALGAMAAALRESLSVSVIAITGSLGKTTTKELAASILSRGLRTARTPGNYNNEIGVPLALLELDRSYRAAVVEMAMRGRGQIAYLARMAKPQVGVVTNIGVSHLELLGSREAIAEAKAELLAALPPDGTAVLNADDEFFGFLRERSPARVVSFGREAEADVRASNVRATAEGWVTFDLCGWWGAREVSLAAAGRHQALNAAAAAAAAMAAGAEPEWVWEGLASFHGAEMRGEISQAPGGYTVIDDCYNAAPDSMRVALELLADLPGRRRWAVLGDMKELGPMGPEWHREVGELVAALGISGLVTVGELAAYIADGAGEALGEAAVRARDNEEATAALRARLAPGDVVLVKGSRAMQMEQIVQRLLAEATAGEGEDNG